MPAGSVPEFILIEGLMGMGKSGVAQAIARMMLSAAVPYRWFFEMEEPNPLGRNNDPSLPQAGIARSATQWERFAKLWHAPPSAIVDGRLLHINVANGLSDGHSEAEIVSSLSEAMRVLRPRDALLFYLYRNDLRSHLERTLETRNDRRWFIEQVESSTVGRISPLDGFELAHSVLESAQSTTMQLLPHFPGEVVKINVDTTSWTEITTIAAQRLGLNGSCLEPRSSDYPRIEGEYLLRSDSKESVVQVTAKGDSLVLVGHPWSRFGGAEHHFTLLPLDDGTFLLRSAPIRFVPTLKDSVVTELWQKGWFSDWGTLPEPLVPVGR